ncbi:MAG TPA: protocatechuate 3,4-dioxygenase subunit alpha [Terriglobales bacterium]|nr:protocatechuate 3,4-dioxygenase subunit alpha [Terriglobales bacterium]
MTLPATTSQTVGPFFRIGLQWLYCDNLVPESIAGERVVVRGQVLDGDGIGVPDAVIEVWQANSFGKYAHPADKQEKPLEPAFRGYGRIPTDDQGTFRFTTIKPGPVPGLDGKEQAPHLLISIFMRGLLKRLTTRMYFPNDARNAADPILNLVAPQRRPTLMAKHAADSLEWNVVLQGTDETVFFDMGL